MEVKISQAIPMIVAYIKAGLVPMILGSPGCGKSQIVHQIAKDFKLKVIDLRLAQCDPTDLLGFPRINNEDRAGYAPMETFPIVGDDLPNPDQNSPEGYDGWLLFLDEMNSASPAVQAAAYKLILDRMVGQYTLHPNVAIVCAGNKETDNAIVQPLSTALQSRMTHLELVIDPKEWVKWATGNGIDHRITSYINFQPNSLYTFKPDHTDKTYAAPRTWEFASRLLKHTDLSDPLIVQLLAGTISEGVAREFVTFCKVYSQLPKIEDIIANPRGIPVSEEPSVNFAITGALAAHATVDNMDELMKYIERLPIEFQLVCLRQALRRNKDIHKTASMKKWITESATNLFD